VKGVLPCRPGVHLSPALGPDLIPLLGAQAQHFEEGDLLFQDLLSGSSLIEYLGTKGPQGQQQQYCAQNTCVHIVVVLWKAVQQSYGCRIVLVPGPGQTQQLLSPGIGAQVLQVGFLLGLGLIDEGQASSVTHLGLKGVD
jgi:hypothetical protein